MTAFKERASLEKKIERTQTNLRKVGQSNYEDLYEFRTDRYIGNLVQYVFSGSGIFYSSCL